MTTSTGKETVQHEIGEDGVLAIQFASGSIAVTATDGPRAIVRELDGQDLEARFHIERTDGRLGLRAREQLLGAVLGRRSIRLSVEFPAGAELTVDTASADIRVTGARGPQRYRTVSGALTILEASGSIGFEVASGEVDISAIGSLVLDGRSVSGDLAVRGGSLERLDLQTTSGDALIDSPLAGSGPFSMQTVSGDARIVAPRGVRVQSTTVSGRVDSHQPGATEPGGGRHAVVVGDGKASMRFRSISGDLVVVAAPGEPAAEPDADTQEARPAPTSSVAEEQPDAHGGERLAILRDLEDGRIDVDEATSRLAALDEGA
jgi:hypothetical protein